MSVEFGAGEKRLPRCLPIRAIPKLTYGVDTPVAELSMTANLPLATRNNQVLDDYVLNRFKLYKIATNGNCLFHTLAWWAYGDQTKHREMRISLCEHLNSGRAFDLETQDGRDRMAVWRTPWNSRLFGDDDSLDKQTDAHTCKDHGIFGNDFVLAAAAHMFRARIILVSETSSGLQFNIVEDDRRTPTRVWWLHYLGNIHYELLAPKQL